MQEAEKTLLQSKDGYSQQLMERECNHETRKGCYLLNENIQWIKKHLSVVGKTNIANVTHMWILRKPRD